MRKFIFNHFGTYGRTERLICLCEWLNKNKAIDFKLVDKEIFAVVALVEDEQQKEPAEEKKYVSLLF